MAAIPVAWGTDGVLMYTDVYMSVGTILRESNHLSYVYVHNLAKTTDVNIRMI